MQRGRIVDEEGFIFSFEESERFFLTQGKVENLGYPELSGERRAGHVSSLPLPLHFFSISGTELITITSSKIVFGSRLTNLI